MINLRLRSPGMLYFDILTFRLCLEPLLKSSQRLVVTAAYRSDQLKSGIHVIKKGGCGGSRKYKRMGFSYKRRYPSMDKGKLKGEGGSCDKKGYQSND